MSWKEGNPGCECCVPTPCEARICVTVQPTGCGFPVSGAKVTITDNASPPNVIGTGVTLGSPGKCCIEIPAAGTYNVTASVAGGADRTATINATCGIDNNVTITYPTGTLGRICFSFGYFDEGPYIHPTPYAGVLVTISPVGGGASSATVASGDDGTVCVVVAPGTYSMTATFPRGKVVSGAPYLPNLTVTSCQTREANPVNVCIGQRISAGGPGNQSCTGIINYYDMSGNLVGSGLMPLVYNALSGSSTCLIVVHMSPELLDGTREIIWPDPDNSYSSTTPEAVWIAGVGTSTGGYIYPQPCARYIPP